MSAKGFVLIEVVLALTIISLLLIPLQRLIGMHFNLERSEKRVKVLSEYEVKIKFLEGYEKNLLDSNVKIGKISGLGIEKLSYNNNIIILRIENKEKYIKIIVPSFREIYE